MDSASDPASPSSSPAPPAAPAVDPQRLIADLRRNDPAAVAEAYRATFGSPLGALVLAHHLAACGVGAATGRGVASDDRHYLAGQQDAALLLMTTAGFDQASAVLAAMTDTLEGRTDDERYAHAEPVPDADPDALP